MEATIARPINIFLHTKADIYELAVAYAHGIVNNHPFFDGNKRMAFVLTDVFLKRNGYAFSMSEKDAVRVMVNLVASEMSHQQYAEFIRANSKRIAGGRSRTGGRKR
jgi:death-on-curing protein